MHTCVKEYKKDPIEICIEFDYFYPTIKVYTLVFILTVPVADEILEMTEVSPPLWEPPPKHRGRPGDGSCVRGWPECERSAQHRPASCLEREKPSQTEIYKNMSCYTNLHSMMTFIPMVQCNCVQSTVAHPLKDLL